MQKGDIFVKAVFLEIPVQGKELKGLEAALCHGVYFPLGCAVEKGDIIGCQGGDAGFPLLQAASVSVCTEKGFPLPENKEPAAPVYGPQQGIAQIYPGKALVPAGKEEAACPLDTGKVWPCLSVGAEQKLIPLLAQRLPGKGLARPCHPAGKQSPKRRQQQPNSQQPFSSLSPFQNFRLRSPGLLCRLVPYYLSIRILGANQGKCFANASMRLRLCKKIQGNAA